MKTISLIIAAALIVPAQLITAQDKPAQANIPPAAKLLSPAVCGKGVFLFTLGDQSLGRETFEIRCQPEGYSATGHTELNLPGGAIDLNTTLETDKAGSPLSSTAKGRVNNSPFEQSVLIKDNVATITNNGKSRELPYQKGTALVGGNIFYMFQFAMAQYDATQGGVQQIPIFPNATMKIERVGRDEVQPAGVAAGGQKAAFDRYNVTIGLASFVVWADAQGRIAAIIVPAQNFNAVREDYKDYAAALKAALASKTKTEEDYSAPPNASFTAEEVTVQAKGFALAGTLLLPKSGKRPFPAVIMITGSGQQTRDEALPLAGLEKYRPFRQIAESLAARGIAVLRVDDRGVGKSTGADTLKTATSFDFADDVRAEIDYLRKRADIDPNRIALVGHSEGGIIAPMVAASDPRIAAIVLMAGTAKRGGAVLADQARDVLERDPSLTPQERAKKLEEQQEAIRAIEEDRDAPGLTERFRSPWMREFLKYDPLATIRKVRQPILILQGALDRQVTAEQAAMLEQAAREAGNKDVTARVFPGLNHLFLPSKTGAFSEYTSLETTSIPDDVLNTLGDWLQQKLKVKR
ncbi:MAG TPA: alpha/beta fold hydrolase [Blastocatellia bacterium]|nr:alpha/beta fold hydrolase [Blastocatellia bacterium]